jgi:hypothetical protein
MLGFWAGNGTVLRITAAAEDAQSLTASLLAGGEWLALAQDLRLRRDGCFHADGSASSLRTLAAGGRLYLVSRTVAGSGRSIDDAAFAQKLSAALPEVSAAWRARAGHVWLAVDEPAASSLYRSNAGPVLQVGEVPGLNGYVTVTTAPYGLQIVNPLESEGVGLMFLQLPGLGSRDMNDLVVQERGGEEWLEYGTTLYRPLDGVADLVRAVTQVTVGPEGYAEWRRLPLAATVGLESAAAGASWRLYGTDMSVLGGGTTFPASVDAPQGACLAVFGPAGSETTVTVSTGVVARTSGGAQGAAAAQIVIPVRPAPSAAPHL